MNDAVRVRKRGHDTGVVVKTGNIKVEGNAGTKNGVTTVTLNNGLFKPDGTLAGNDGIATIVHEGSHVVDQKNGPMPATAQDSYDTERRTYGSEGVFRRAMGMGAEGYPNGLYTLYHPSWEGKSDLANRMKSGARQRAWYGSACGQGWSCKGGNAW